MTAALKIPKKKRGPQSTKMKIPEWVEWTQRGWIDESALRRTIRTDHRNNLSSMHMALMREAFNEGTDWKRFGKDAHYWSPEGCEKVRRHWRSAQEEWTRVKFVRECPNKTILLGKLVLKDGTMLQPLERIRVQQGRFEVKSLRLTWCVRQDGSYWQARKGNPPLKARIWDGKDS